MVICIISIPYMYIIIIINNNNLYCLQIVINNIRNDLQCTKHISYEMVIGNQERVFMSSILATKTHFSTFNTSLSIFNQKMMLGLHYLIAVDKVLLTGGVIGIHYKIINRSISLDMICM